MCYINYGTRDFWYRYLFLYLPEKHRPPYALELKYNRNPTSRDYWNWYSKLVTEDRFIKELDQIYIYKASRSLLNNGEWHPFKRKYRIWYNNLNYYSKFLVNFNKWISSKLLQLRQYIRQCNWELLTYVCLAD